MQRSAAEKYAVNPAFRATQRDYGRQYAGLYWTRLETLKPLLRANAVTKWNTNAGRSYPYVDKLLDVEAGQVCIVVGTVYMDMPAKPNILDEVANDVRMLVM